MPAIFLSSRSYNEVYIYIYIKKKRRKASESSPTLEYIKKPEFALVRIFFARLLCATASEMVC